MRRPLHAIFLAFVLMGFAAHAEVSTVCPPMEDGKDYLFLRSDTKIPLRFFSDSDPQHPVLMIQPEMGVIDRGETICHYGFGDGLDIRADDFESCPAELPVFVNTCHQPYSFFYDGMYHDSLWVLKLTRLKGTRAYVTYRGQPLWIDLSTLPVKWKIKQFHEKDVEGC